MTLKNNLLNYIAIFLVFCVPSTAFAAGIDGSGLNLLWGIPFVGVLLSIALCPILIPQIWHHHFGKIMLLWAIVFIVPFILSYGVVTSLELVAHAMLLEFLPFIILLLALFTVSGGILIDGNLHGSAKLNTAILAIGTLLASFMGTTGAAMLLIRPLLRANDNRKHRVHVVVFFIFLVANIGGGLTPLGDPPLFLGFLKGVDFFWTVKYMLAPIAFMSLILLVLFYFVDRYYFAKEDELIPPDPTPDGKIKIIGKFNFVLLLAVVGSVLLSGFWQPNIVFHVLAQPLELQNIVRDGLLLLISLISMVTTSKKVRRGNEFNWEPMFEVGKIFAAIFVTIGPVIAILRAGTEGQLASFVTMVTDVNHQPINSMYFWMSGLLSAFLDNAPTYLVFFNLASGDPITLMSGLKTTLLAISMGSVFMGAMTYIGNAPNFMIRSIAVQGGVKMPSFFGYMKWSAVFLIPLFILLTFIFF